MVTMDFLTINTIIDKKKRSFSTRPQGSGNVMIWASFGWAVKNSIRFVDGRMNSNGYREVPKII